jgi:signal transduction histidine kinase
MICHYFEQPSYLFFASDLPALLYYSHIPVSVIALLVGFFVFFSNPKRLLNRLLFGISICFTAWTVFNLIAWTNIDSSLLMFSWTFFGILQAFVSILCIYFVYAFLNNGQDVSLKIKAVFATLLLPVLLFSHTDLNVSGFNISDCDAFGYEGFLYNAYYTALGLVAMVWIFVLMVRHYKRATEAFKKQMLLMGIGMELFLFMFFTIVYLASYLTNIGLFENSDLEMYGLFGMVIFMTFIGVLIVKFKSFNVGASASTALVMALIILTASQFTYVDSRAGVGVTTVTLVLTGLLAVLLLRSVRAEIKQRMKLTELTNNLEKANGRLKSLDKQKSEFVSIASHQLRSPLTAIRGYASLLLEGSFGTIPQKSVEPLSRIDESAKLMALAIEDYLNVSRIEAGNMKYHLADFNLPTEVEHITDDVRANAIKKGLVLYYKKSLHNQGVIHADKGKTVQIIHNLIDNAVKYTVKGTITVLVRDDIKKKKIFVDVIDTGIGMDDKTQDNIFQKFGRADNANSVNISGTGLGLFVAHKMAEAMGGDITAHSKGDDQGSRFTLELPLAM